MMKKFLFLALTTAVFGSAFAEGYQVNNMSAKQTGMGHVGTAMKLNSESIFFNPAAASFQRSACDISVGFTGILSEVRYRALPTLDNDYTEGAPQRSNNKLSTPLHIYMNYKPIDRLSIGVGFFTPYGSSIDWGDDWSGAHLVQRIDLKSYTVQPTVSFKVCDRLSIGAGLMITWGDFDLSRSLLSQATRRSMIDDMIAPTIDQLEKTLPLLPDDNPDKAAYAARLQMLQGASAYLTGTMDRSIVSAKLQGRSKVAIGVNAGLLWDITDEWSVGMTWRSRMNMKVNKGHATMYTDPQAAALIARLEQMIDKTLLPPLDRGTFNAELPLPTVVTWGVSFRPTPRWELAVDLQWNGWSAYKALNVEFNETQLGIEPIYSVKNYSNTLAFRFGGQYRATDWLTARIGMYVDESPVDSNYLNPETPSMTKVSYTAGLSLRPAKLLSIDLAYCYVSSADPERTGSYPIYEYGNPSQLTEVFSGNYKLHAHVFSVGVGISF